MPEGLTASVGAAGTSEVLSVTMAIPISVPYLVLPRNGSRKLGKGLVDDLAAATISQTMVIGSEEEGVMAVVEAVRSEPAAGIIKARMLIGGDWIESASGEVLPVENPAKRQ